MELMSSQKASPSPLSSWTRALQYSTRRGDDQATTLLASVRRALGDHGDRLALRDEMEALSYTELVSRSNDYANWGYARGLRTGDVVGLLMRNGADYVAIWLGLTEIGCIVALFNTNLHGDAIAHAFDVAGCRLLICEACFLSELRTGLGCLVLCGREEVAGLVNVTTLDKSVFQPERAGIAVVGPSQTALLIFTSGTTGLPKATRISHGRILEWSFWFAGMMDASQADRLYDALPLYHSTGGIVAIGAMLTQGGSVEIRRRFSARAFWQDAARSGCTIFQYIGELCRYLTLVEPSHYETDHSIRLFCGNGLNADIWSRVQERFAIPRVLEFYAATEGGLSLYNCEGRIGSVGRIPPFLRDRLRVAVVRIDRDTGELVRDVAGLCIGCATGEAGEAISELGSAVSASPAAFEGYTNELASSRKIALDVFRRADRWFRSGDLMRCDEQGFFYFVDRLGDSFRWKGENVSATDVANVVACCAGVRDAVVYGVRLDGVEGQAGMAALAVSEHFSFAELRTVLQARLPDYAEPVFVRLCDRIEATGTFKLLKGELQRDGVAGALAAGGLWFNDRNRRAFVRCDQALLTQIMTGAMRL